MKIYQKIIVELIFHHNVKYVFLFFSCLLVLLEIFNCLKLMNIIAGIIAIYN